MALLDIEFDALMTHHILLLEESFARDPLCEALSECVIKEMASEAVRRCLSVACVPVGGRLHVFLLSLPFDPRPSGVWRPGESCRLHSKLTPAPSPALGVLHCVYPLNFFAGCSWKRRGS